MTTVKKKQLLGLLLFMGGMAYCGVGILNFLEASEIENWPQTWADVKISKVKSRIENGGEHQGQGQVFMYSLKFAYDYTVKGVKFSGSQVSATKQIESSDPNGVQAIVSRYPASKPVQIHYNPMNPNKAFLEIEPSSKHYPTILMGLLITLIGGFIMSLTSKEKKNYF